MRRAAPLCAGIVAALALAACNHEPKVDMETLDRAGMDYASVQQLKNLRITTPEITEVLNLHNAGFSDAECVQAVQIFHGKGQPLRADDLTDMRRAGLRDETIFTLASLNDFGRNAGELAAMHLAGLSDEVIVEVARRRADGKPVLAGASLARLKNVGVRSATLLELVRRGVPDSEANAILAFRRHGASDKDILRHYSGS